jgi:primosomal protein N' (replication factor Y)
MTAPLTAQILLPRPLAQPLDYAIPAELAGQIALGDYVDVPIGHQETMGIVWGLEASHYPAHKLKAITDRRNVPAMPDTLRRFIDWVATYTMQPLGAVLKLALSADSAQPPSTHIYYMYDHGVVLPAKLTSARQKVITFLQDEPTASPHTMADIGRKAGVSPEVVRGLAKLGVLKPIVLDEDASHLLSPTQGVQAPLTPLILTAEQHRAAEMLEASMKENKFSATLLEGVTGSGKTEVYATAIRQQMAQGKQVLVLFPEIGLSAQMMERFTTLFGVAPVIWHSDLTPSKRQRAWRQIASGNAQLVMGARSALFLPFKQLGLIVVDEEHEQAYKQEEGVSYHARDMAVVRARLEDCPALLVSATPSIESVVNVEEGRYRHLVLPNRYGGAQLPTVKLIDLTKHAPPRGRWLSGEVVQAMRDTLARKEQVLLFLNRRGYAPLTLCRACGYRLECSHCSAWMIDHRKGRAGGKLMCHHCGTKQNMPTSCPSCSATDSFVPCGPGVERVAEEAAQLFPDAKQALFTSDIPQTWRETTELVTRIEQGDVDIIIGTQILAKGYHFPKLTLVIVVDGDMGLDGGELRARERCFQLLHQVGGRAGRAELPGSVFVQSHSTDNLIFQLLAKNDRDGFVAHEIEQRERYHQPPFARLAAVIISGRDLSSVENTAQEMRMKYILVDGVEIFGPAPAPLSKLRDEHRVRLLLRAPRECKLQAVISAWLSRVTLPKGVTLKIVIDPVTFM